MDFLHNMKTATCPSATANIWVWNFFGGCYQIIEQPISSNISGAIIPFKNFGIINTFLSDLYDVSSIWYSAIGVSLVLILALVSSCIFPSKVCLFVCRTLMSSSVKLWKLRKWGIQQVNAHWVFCAKVKSCLQMGQFPQDGENGQNVAFFLLWPNVLTFSTFLNCSEQILPGAF